MDRNAGCSQLLRLPSGVRTRIDISVLGGNAVHVAFEGKGRLHSVCRADRSDASLANSIRVGSTHRGRNHWVDSHNRNRSECVYGLCIYGTPKIPRAPCDSTYRFCRCVDRPMRKRRSSPSRSTRSSSHSRTLWRNLPTACWSRKEKRSRKPADPSLLRTTSNAGLSYGSSKKSRAKILQFTGLRRTMPTASLEAEERVATDFDMCTRVGLLHAQRIFGRLPLDSAAVSLDMWNDTTYAKAERYDVPKGCPNIADETQRALLEP